MLREIRSKRLMGLLDLGSLLDLSPQTWFTVGIIFIVFALVPGILFALVGVLAVLFGLFTLMNTKQTRGREL